VQRAQRGYERRRQGKLAKVPADLLARFHAAGAAAISIIVMDCVRTGSCERPVARIAGSATISERAVQYALQDAQRRGLLLIQRRKGHTNLITMLDPALIAWAEGLDGYREAPPIEGEKIKDFQSDNNSPPRGANGCAPSPSRPVRRPAPIEAEICGDTDSIFEAAPFPTKGDNVEETDLERRLREWGDLVLRRGVQRDG
jgi:hypothetical protein